MRNAHIDKMNHRLRQKIKLAVTEQPAIEGKRAKRERERDRGEERLPSLLLFPVFFPLLPKWHGSRYD